MIDLKPYRFRETSFRRYEDLIAKVISSFPTCVVVEPTKSFNLSPITFSCRFRDAMKSLANNGWDSNKINKASFHEIHKQIVVRERSDGTIAIGDRESSKQKPKLIFEAPASRSAEVIELQTPEQKHFICLLATKRVLHTPIEVSNVTKEEVETLQNAYDVYLEETNNGTFLLR